VPAIPAVGERGFRVCTQRRDCRGQAAPGCFWRAGAFRCRFQRGWHHAGLNPIMAPLLGMLSGIGGGMLRDVLVAEIPTMLRSDLYAVAALAGAVVMVLEVAFDNQIELCFDVVEAQRFQVAAPPLPRCRDPG
jgi:hypothetical protein